jgi:hypothetical protein
MHANDANDPVNRSTLTSMGSAATGFPLFPSGYTAGTITIAAGQAGVPQQLLALIQLQLDVNCQGAGREVTLQADSSGALYVGCQTTIGGALSTTNYGYVLDKAQAGFIAGASRTYRSTFPGNNATIGDLMVLMTGAGTFHVEVE